MTAPAILQPLAEDAICVTIVDASDEGAKIATEAEIKMNHFGCYRLKVPDLFESDCLCIWQRQNHAGLLFLQPLQADVLQDLSEVFPAQPEKLLNGSLASGTVLRSV